MSKEYVSSVEGQKTLFYRASAINTLKLLNQEIGKLDPTEMWHPDNIECASNEQLDELRVSMSQCLDDLQRQRGSKYE